MLYWLILVICLTILWKYTGEFKFAALYVIYFAAGVIVKDYSKETWLSNKTTASISFIIICLATCFWTSGATSIINILLKIIVSFAVIQQIFKLCTEYVWNYRIDSFVKRCEKCSIAIYILHWTFLPLAPYHPMFPHNEFIGLLSTSLFAIIISYICCNIYDYISRIPILNFIFFGQRK